ncbi:MAG: S-methyl-5'-thioadenosine phosphorylase [Patescibacteria group bacterium]
MIGVFGGSGFYKLLENAERKKIETPFGDPSGEFIVGEYAGKKVAFLPRHGECHSVPPHKINYRANIWGMRELGVTQIFSPCAAGSLQARVKPGDFVIADQYVDRTNGRADTFFEGPEVRHISQVSPYCDGLRSLAIAKCQELGINCHERGTVVVINGPRFSTAAESRWFSSAGFEVINMTQYPEVVLANELGICFVNISLITDHDAGLVGQPGIKESSVNDIFATFKSNNERLRELLFKMIESAPEEPCAACQKRAEEAKIVQVL